MESLGYRRKRQLWWILLLSSGYMVMEIVGGILTDSLALLADAGHMAIDVAAIGLSLFASWVASKPPTDEKTYGYYRAEILAALVNGATLIAVSLWIFYEAWLRLKAPPSVGGFLMTVIASGGFVINVIGLFLVRKESHQNLNMRGVWIHLLSDTLGSLSAVAAGILVWGWGWNYADPIGSLVIGILILYNSWKLLGECVNVLLEGVPRGININEIKSWIESLDSIKEVHDLHVWTVTSGVNALSAHVILNNEAVDHCQVLETITKLLRERYKIDHVTLQLEPSTFTHHEMHF